MEFLKRTMPLGARFPTGEVFREDRFPVPLDALREILLNAVMHRDYSHYSGYVAIVVFDDRIEVQSYGRLPTGITVEQLSGPHRSKPINPLIAEAFHRTGAVEVWGRGTNKVIAMCKQHGAAAPTFEEQQGFLIVTFKAQMVAGTPSESALPDDRKTSEKTSEKILTILAVTPETTIAELASKTGITTRSVERNLRALLARGRLRRVGPDKGGHWDVVK